MQTENSSREFCRVRAFTFKEIGFVRRILIAAVCAVLITAFSVRAQGTAAIVGTVTDSSGGVVLGATVTLTNTGTNISQVTQTTSDGDYVFNLVLVGTYAVKVEAKGFKAFIAPSLSVSAGDRTRVDAKMEVGNVSQTVEVSGSVAPALETDTSTIGSLVTSQAVEDVPLNGRNVTKLVQLAPGVTQGGTGSIVAGGRPDDRRQTDAFSVNGQNDALNQAMIDGLDNNERIVGGNIARPSIDAIQEVNISTNKYDASVGRTGGGVVNIVTKAGTNDFHGSAYEFFRNKVLNTNPGYSFPSNSLGGMTTVPTNPPYRQNQYGVSLGGPIKKNKAFFFADIERFSQAYGLPQSTLSVPSLCERGSNLAKLEGYTGSITCPDGMSPVNIGDFSDLPSISQPGGSTSPCSNATGGNYGTAACPYVVIPASAITKLGSEYMSMYPLPNCASLTSTCSSYTGSPTRSQTSQTVDTRVDYHFSDENTFYARYTLNHVVTETPPSFPNVSIDPSTGLRAASGASGALTFNPVASASFNGFPGPENERQQSSGVSFVHVYNPNLVLDLKAGYNRNILFEAPPNFQTNISNKLGFTCNTTPNYLSPLGACINAPGLVYTTGLATVSPTGFASIGDTAATPLFETDNVFQEAAVLTWNKGAHSIRFGVALIRRQVSVGEAPAGQGPEGTFPFTGAYTGNGLGDMLEGYSLGAATIRSYPTWQGSLGVWEPSGYVQDDWRARHWLTLNLGLRYDIFTPYTEHRNRITNFDQATGLMVGPAITGQQQSNSTAGVKTDFTNLAPRFGFAATMPHQTVIRGGFGLSFFPTNYQSQYNLKNAPGTFVVSCQNQNQTNTNNPCLAPFASGVVAQYGLPTSNTTSPVGKSGGLALANALPVPYANVNLVFAPTASQCFFDTPTDYATTCPLSTDPYQSYSISNAVPFNFPSEYLIQGNLQVEKAFGENVITIGGITNLGRHTPKGINIQSLSNPGQKGVLPLSSEFPWLAKTATIQESGNWGSDSYNALQVTLVRRFSKGLTAQFNYTWAHAETFTGGSCIPTQVQGTINPCYYDNPANPASPIAVNYWKGGGFANGNSAYDVADRFAWTTNYEVPFGKSLTGIEGAIAKGWAANMAGSWQTGLPFGVTTGVNRTGLSAAGNPDQICSGRVANPTMTHWFNAACFVEQYGTNVFGNEHGSQLMGPPQRNLDFSLFKEFSINERFRMQFRTEVFNLFNTPNFANPSASILQFPGGPGTPGSNANTNPNSVPVGTITSLNSNQTSRVIQFGLKLLF